MQASARPFRLARTRARLAAARDRRSGKVTWRPIAGSRDGKIRLVSSRREGCEQKVRSCKDAVLAESDVRVGAGAVAASRQKKSRAAGWHKPRASRRRWWGEGKPPPDNRRQADEARRRLKAKGDQIARAPVDLSLAPCCPPPPAHAR